MCDVSGLAPAAVFERLREAGLGSTPGTAAEVLHDGVRERISPNKLPVARWVEIIEASHAEGIRSTVTVMFGHIEEPWELAEHMRVVRELQERTGGFTEFVPLSFIPFHTLLGRTHGVRGDLPRGEPQAHGRVPPGARAHGAQPPGELGEDGARRGHRGAALGGQRPRRHADGGVDLSRMAGSYHGVRLEPEDLIAAAHRAGRPAAERTTLYEIRRRYAGSALARVSPTARARAADRPRERAERPPSLFAGVEPLEVFVELLAEIDTDTSSTEFYDRICEAICRLTTMRRAAIFMADAGRRRVRAVGSHGTSFSQLAALRPTLVDTPIAQRALLEDQVVVVSERIEEAVPAEYAQCSGSPRSCARR